MTKTPKIRIRVIMYCSELRFEIGIKRGFFWKNGRVFDAEKQALEYINQYVGYADKSFRGGGAP